uniref:Uncharacterized protein n=1 Tax=Arundo donax TaxID=35708 RepID=A0A0A9BQR1_ARUDO
MKVLVALGNMLAKLEQSQIALPFLTAMPWLLN